MTINTFKSAWHRFSLVAAPYLNIRDEQHYQEALMLIESFLEEAEDSHDDPINGVIELLSRAIESYENKDTELAEFERRSMAQASDVATNRLLGIRRFRSLIERHGGAYSAKVAAELMGISAENLEKIRQRKTILAYRVGESWYFPAFQFGDQGELVPGIKKVLRSLSDLNPKEQILFFLRSVYDGKTAIDLLKESNEKTVLHEAEHYMEQHAQ